MALIRDFLARVAPRLAEGDPLPPDDRVTLGSTLVLEDLYRTQAPRLVRHFARRADPQDAEDLAQDSFVRLADAQAAPGKVIEKPDAYLQGIATNLLRDRARSALQRSLANSIPIEKADLSAPDMLASLEARDMIERIQKALMRLPPRTREIFLAHRLDGDGYSEIAARMGLSVKGIEWHMSKATASI